MLELIRISFFGRRAQFNKPISCLDFGKETQPYIMLWRNVIKPTHDLNPENLKTPIYLVMDSVIKML